MKSNHTLRIRLSKEEKESIDRLYQDLFPELKKTYFYKQLTLKGYEMILLKLINSDPEQTRRLLISKK
jgi:hypothetical protein